MTLADTTIGRKFHHGAKTYAEADSEAARFALHKIETRIESAVANAQQTLERIFTEVPTDAMVRSKAMNFQMDPDAESPDLILDAGDKAWHLHKNARMQVFQRGFTRLGGYANAVLENGNADERTQLVHMLNTHYNTRDARYLTRSLPKDETLEMRGFLSDHYKVIDSRPTAETFVKQCGSLGLVPLEGTVTDTRAYLKFLLPKVYEPVPNEIMAFGLTYQNSDFGNGTLLIRSFMYRCWCTNQAMMDDMLREVHLGAKLPEGVAFSDETKRLNAETSCSVMKDVIQGSLSEDAVGALCAKIETAATAKMTWAQLNDKLKDNMNKGEREAVKTAFEGPDVEMLPAGGETKWRASNAVSFIANSIKDADRRATAQRVAGALVQ